MGSGLPNIQARQRIAPFQDFIVGCHQRCANADCCRHDEAIRRIGVKVGQAIGGDGHARIERDFAKAEGDDALAPRIDRRWNLQAAATRQPGDLSKRDRRDQERAAGEHAGTTVA